MTVFEIVMIIFTVINLFYGFCQLMLSVAAFIRDNNSKKKK